MGQGLAFHRCLRAGHVRKGRPGTWEVSSSPSHETRRGRRAKWSGSSGSASGPGGAKETKRGEKSESAGSTDEAGTPAPRDPVEGSGRPGSGTCGGTDGGGIGPECHRNATTQDSDMGIAAKPQPEEPDA